MPDSRDIDTLADEYWAYRHATDHFTSLWRGDLTYLAEWEDLSAEGTSARRQRLREFATRADALLDHASNADRALLESIAFTARSTDLQLELRDEIEWVNHTIGLHPTLLAFLPRYPLQTREHGDQYLEKLRRIPTMLDQLTERLRGAISTGRVPIRTCVLETARQITDHLDLPLDQHPLLAQVPPTALDEAAASRWQEQLRTTVSEVVLPAFGQLGRFLTDELAPQARPDQLAGICHLEEGEEIYRKLVWAHTTVDLTPEQVHQIGLEQVDRLADEYRQLAGPLFDTSDLGEIFSRLREDEDLHYHDGEEVVADATRALGRATDAVQSWFGVLPQAPCEVAETKHGALAFYSHPAKDGSKPGRFFFNTADPTGWARFELEAITYHEGTPGHHLQMAISLELPLHEIHQELYITAYNEGWGLYSERLSDEMGLYSSDLDRVGMLAADSMRACRLVVDTGMHALGWTRDQAIEYVIDNSPMSRHQATEEIDRYIGNPGQALGYMIGRLEIDQIRCELESELGEAFDIRSFHDAVLGTGAVPLPTLRRITTEALAST